MTYIGHGGKEIVERVLEPEKAAEAIKGLTPVPIRGQIAREIIDIAYGFFTPLEGFMTRADVEGVCNEMKLANGVLWPIPIVFDISTEEINEKGIKEGDKLLLTYQDKPMAILEVEEIFTYDKQEMAQKVYGTTEDKHPGVARTYNYKDKFIGGKITLVNPPKINPPFDEFFFTPKQLRQKFAEKGWQRVVAHQTRNVPHTGHEWLMKGAWLSTHGELPVEKTLTGVLVNAIIGEKRKGDYIDEAIVLCHDVLRKAGYFREDVHLTSITLWDMRYAGPKEAVFHAILRSNLGLTHHMFGRDHAGVGTYYDPYDAHRIFDQIPEGALNIKPIRVLAWWYCPICGEVTYSGLCGHKEHSQNFSGTLIRSIIQDGVKPPRLIFRPEVFDLIMECAEKYGFGSAFVTDKYLKERNPVFSLPDMKY
ncbi:sulfate adenylyltransferase [Desulfofundulus sp. TPOSR]|jgi:sulfate adenylyltransferase|uniref:sulfate adenylyltransferase n=1 Tax=Desulfofundulus kuznetsovii (strain DSM 6115 / VKM B-1805 / 17) TaxID=760568 RepID=A0AAU8P9N2_DESK7|nr:sulfate adenylyltransferase [Desulfofundulus sp. TPOSR]AEG14658.1 sulfate adenylyltransferase [Desulfofundulus kuznetsovii DSM 6115]NHM25868.1 sulfate adenylyltransferase [Desulfofundulus sp. TPOSR]QSS05753.1 sulfate adenylyltransferase [Klebsiella pneumoniae]